MWAVDTWNRAISQDIIIQLEKLETEEVIEDNIDEEIGSMDFDTETIEDEFFEVETRNDLEEYYINPHLKCKAIIKQLRLINIASRGKIWFQLYIFV